MMMSGSFIINSLQLVVFILIGVFLLVSTILYDLSEGKLRSKFRKYHNGLISKFMKRNSYGILCIIWILYCIYAIAKLSDLSGYYRFIVSLFLIVIIIILNYKQNLIFKLIEGITKYLISIFRLLSSAFPKKLNVLERVEKKKVLRIPHAEIIIAIVVLLSFSFDLILNEKNFIIVGWILQISVIIYLLFALINLFKMQKDLFYLSDQLRIADIILTELNIEKNASGFIKAFFPFIMGFVNNHFLSEKDTKSKLKLLKEKVFKLRMFSNYGLSYLKTALSIRLFIILFITVLFVIITQANYYLSIVNLNLIKSDYLFYSNYILNSFHLFIGENVTAYNYMQYSSSFAYFNLVSALIGWFLVVIFIIMFMDILSLSLDEFTKTIKKMVNTIIPEAIKIIDTIMEVKPKEISLENLKDSILKFSNRTSFSDKDENTLLNVINAIEDANKKLKK